ncbi:MAG: RHS repeat-associated core domain-containing protein, partial [Acidobacteria bacterium]|nr:RHS repeat-associated core domain-containing protein [Acidobacteriota bacterium]
SGYDTFGTRSGIVTTRFGYTGREHDPDTGLMYYRARWYSPETGRFVSEDPIGLAGGINLYAYVENDPFNSIDPSGLQKKGGGSKSTSPPAPTLPTLSPQSICPTVPKVVVVNIWYPKGKNYGHASLTLSDGKNLGWWPSEDPDPAWRSFWGVPGHTKTYLKEVEVEGRSPDYAILFYGLNEEKIKAAYAEATQNGWNIGQRSCTSVAIRSLNAGVPNDADKIPQIVINEMNIIEPEMFHGFVMTLRRRFGNRR